MSDLNDSVIICDTLPSSKQRKTIPSTGKTQAVKTKKKTFYECSLRNIQLSGRRREQEMKAKQKLNCNEDKQREVENNENDLLFNIGSNSSRQDSIIILSDNESEKDKDFCENNSKTKKRYMESLDNNSNRTLKRKRSPILLRSRKRKAICISDTEDSDIENENIVPLDSVNQSADDIVVVWSSKNINLSNRRTKKSNIVKESVTSDNLINLEKDEAETSDIVNEVVTNDNLINLEKDEAETSDIIKEGVTNDNLINLEKDEAETVSEKKRNEEIIGKETTTNQVVEKDVLEEGEIRDEEDDAEAINVTRVEDDRLFMIDCSPDPKNLHCLITAKRYKGGVKDNDARKTQMVNDTDLPFNQKSLRLPIAENISGSITVEKSKSFYKFSEKVKKKILKLKNKDKKASKSTEKYTFKSVMPDQVKCPRKGLREIVIDGNNVAMSHANGKSFSEKGLRLVINFFQSRGHSVKVFVPQYRRTATAPLLEKWYSEGIVVFTPSRIVAGKRITPYDDRYILQYATMCRGIVISSDQFRDLYNQNPEWDDTIEKRLLAPTFVGDIVMFPDDPLGRKGPNLEEFLKF